MSTIKFQIQDTLTVLCKNVEKGHKVLLNVRKYDELISQLREAYQGDLKEVREDKSMNELKSTQRLRQIMDSTTSWEKGKRHTKNFLTILLSKNRSARQIG
ncbi:unnamed protein product [Dracunculus medinensis]|uniref:Antitoxin n=1 Tax=Dracunculus medinensis TaxID=318479 RepID=A0A0N4UM55_DRAME|nr:unnamed protein product [Dracunculus medinensis]